MAEAAAAASVQSSPADLSLDVPMEEEPPELLPEIDGFELGSSQDLDVSMTGGSASAFISGELSDFSQQGDASRVAVAMRFVDHRGQPTEQYPLNPNGSPNGVTSVTTPDGRFTVLMPHTERVHRTVQMSWAPAQWSAAKSDGSPWMRVFQNARRWLG